MYMEIYFYLPTYIPFNTNFIFTLTLQQIINNIFACRRRAEIFLPIIIVFYFIEKSMAPAVPVRIGAENFFNADFLAILTKLYQFFTFRKTNY